MKVKYLDLKTGETAVDTGISQFNLTDGNYSCDCNRAIPFDRVDHSDICLGHRRYVVIGVEPETEHESFNPEEIISEANREYWFYRVYYAMSTPN